MQHANALLIPNGRLRMVLLVEEEGVSQFLDLPAPRYPGPQRGHYLHPGLGARLEPISPLMAWWALLLALSSVARYEPSLWAAALERARELMALLVLEALETPGA